MVEEVMLYAPPAGTSRRRLEIDSFEKRGALTDSPLS